MVSPGHNGPVDNDIGLGRLLLDWYASHRRDLPWRRTSDPYAIWISETMLQQTQVATAIPFWERWMARFPTVQGLASASLDDVLAHWAGLGYYARARNLHAAAKKVVEDFGGVFPSDPDDLRSLPGVGRYTAAAVASIAFGRDIALVDANVVRVLCRLDAVGGDPKSPKVVEGLWGRAGELLVPGQAGDFNQALMELGALVCQPTPHCRECPWQAHCRGLESGDPASFPRFAPKPAPTRQTDVCAVVRRGDSILLVRRPEGGLWGGLWEMPRVVAGLGEDAATAAERACREIVGLEGVAGSVLATHAHGVTTRRIQLFAVECKVAEGSDPTALGCDSTAWVDRVGRGALGLPSPQARLWEKLMPEPADCGLFAGLE